MALDTSNVMLPTAENLGNLLQQQQNLQQQAEQIPQQAEQIPQITYPGRIHIYTSTYQDRFGATHIRYWSDKAPNGNHAQGSFQITSSRGNIEYTPEQAIEKVYQDSTN